MDFLLRMEAWLSGLIFLVLMFLSWWAGVRIRRRRGESAPACWTHIEDAYVALFGLVLAFWFAGAASRYQERKVLLREDAISIGDFATVASALEEPASSGIHRELLVYVNQRLKFGNTTLDDPEFPRTVAEGRAIQRRLWAMVVQAIAAKNTPSVHAPLVNSYNGMVMASEKRLYGINDHVPETILVMLVVLGMFTTFTMGRLIDQSQARAAPLFRVVVYIVLVVLVFTVTLDLEQPRRGIMRVSPAPMQDLLHTLSKP